MSNWYRLNFSTTPTKDRVHLKKFNGTRLWSIYTNPLDLLSYEVKNTLLTLGVEPSLMVVFEAKEQTRVVSYLHKDLTWKNNQWQTVPCAINWELQPIQTTISWFNTDACDEYWPDKNFDETRYPLNYLNGIGYKPGDEFGVPDGAVLLQQAEVDHTAPILFRTDVAHCVQFRSQLPYRFTCSLRFSNIDNWDYAVEIFQKLIVDSN